MKTKLMDFETDWDLIKETQLSFLMEKAQDSGNIVQESPDSKRSSGGIAPASLQDQPEAVLRALVFMALNN